MSSPDNSKKRKAPKGKNNKTKNVAGRRKKAFLSPPSLRQEPDLENIYNCYNKENNNNNNYSDKSRYDNQMLAEFDAEGLLNNK